MWTRLQQRIFFLVVCLFTLVFCVTLYSIYKAALNQATRGYDTQLTVGRNVFLEQISTARSHLNSSVNTIARDWALRQAIAQDSNDLESIQSILFNHSQRINSDIANIFDIDLNRLAVYGAAIPADETAPYLNNSPLSHTWIALVDDKPYLFAAESINVPAPIGWLVMGKEINLEFLTRLKELVSLEINLIAISDADVQLPLSTSNNPDHIRMNLGDIDFSLNSGQEKSKLVRLNDENVAVLAFEVFSSDEQQFVVLLHESLAVTMASVNLFLVELVPYFVVGVIFAVVGSFLISSSITQPVEDLLKAARHISGGNYNAPINISERSELGLLAKEFSHMQHAVMEREQKIKDQAFEIEQTNKLKYEKEIAQKEKEIAESATQAKSQFLANICHEIRTPLTSVIGYADMLKDNTVNQNEKFHAISTISKSGYHMLGIVNDVLDVSKIEANKIELEIVDQPIQSLVSEVSSLIQVSAKQKQLDFNIHFHYPIPSHFVTDPMRIKQILLNLCNNAVKFTSEGQVELHVHFDQKKQRLIFVVADTGPGMSEKQVNRLFTAFTQADESTSRKFGGTGLGLYISQQFAEMLGGHIKVTSEIDVGSQFAIYLPWQTCDSNQMILDEEPYHDMPAQNESDKILIPKLVGNVLCADDNEDNRRLLTYLLAHTGLDVVMVSDGEKAVSHAQNNELDLILMDMQMPNMDGLEATQIIKKSLPTLPIVMLTANVDAQSIQRMEQSGVDENLGKPIDRAAFYALLRNYLPEKKQNTTSNKAKPTKETYEESFKKLAEEYKGRLPQKATELEFALNEQDWKSLKGLAHKLKGSAGSYGFPEVSELAGSVEFALDEENIPHAKTQLSSLFDYIEQTQNTTGV